MPKELIVCGPAGSGKTFPILAFLHRLAADNDNLRILLCRQTRSSLTNSVLVTLEQEIFPADGCESLAYGVNRRNRQSYLYPSGSELVTGGLDKPDRILSTAWDAIYVNEAIEAEEQGWDTLGSRLDRPGRPKSLGFLIGDTNPGDPAHWLKKRCDEGRTVLWDTSHRANPLLYDGTDWTPDGVIYHERLDNLRGTRRKRLKDGLWAAGEGAWFDTFDPDRHVTSLAEYDPNYPVHLGVDTGDQMGAVWFQVKGEGDSASVNVFGDYFSQGVHAFEVGRQILAVGQSLCGGGYDVGRYDPSGGSHTGFGAQTIVAEFERAGLRLKPWVRYGGSTIAGLNLLESFVATDPPAFAVHPRCVHLINAFPNYKRAKRGGQFIDEPHDPQHPYEDLIDPLRSALLDKFPHGRRPEPRFRRTVASHVMY